MILDASAGNRHIWQGQRPDEVIFMDKETRLLIPPDLFATWGALPFRADIFDCVIFDPPHQTAGGKLKCQWTRDPKESNGTTWYGAFRNDRELKITLFHAQAEFSRVSSRMCFKWCSDERFGSKNIFRILNLFTNWSRPHPLNPVRTTKTHATYWVKMIRKQAHD